MAASTLKRLLDGSPEAALLDAAHHGKDREIILPLLETELQRSSLRLQRLKEYRNSLASPIHCLPPEILSKVFFIYASDNDELFNLRWTRVLLVCRRWYKIAQDVQVLWGFIDVSLSQRYTSHTTSGTVTNGLNGQDTRRIEAQRSHAGLAPLTIRVRAYEPSSEADLCLGYLSAFWEQSRLLSLDVGGEQRCVENIIRSTAAHRHAQLKELKVHRYFGMWAETQAQEIQTSASLNMMLKDNAPCLQYLSISGLSIDFNLLHGLRSLCIAYPMNAPLLFGLQDIISALNCCPQLGVLEITLPIEPQPDHTVTSTAVPMVHLRKIIVQGTVLVCTNLLQALVNLPSAAKIFAVTGAIAEASSISALTAYMGGHASCKNALGIRSILITHEIVAPEGGFGGLGGGIAPMRSRSRLGVVAQAWPIRHETSGQYRPIFDHEHEGSPYVGIDIDVLADVREEATLNILLSWPLSKTTHLDLRLAGVTSRQISVFLAKLPSVNAVIVRPEATNARALVATLREQLQQYGLRAVTHIIFDAQQAKALTQDIGAPQSPSQTLARLSLMRTLSYCAEAARAGLPLDTIEVVNGPQHRTGRMIDRVEEVDWSELYRDLHTGFVYEGALHSGRCDLDGMKWDSFSVADNE